MHTFMKIIALVALGALQTGASKPCTTGASACAGAPQRVDLGDTTYCCFSGKMDINYPDSCTCSSADDALASETDELRAAGSSTELSLTDDEKLRHTPEVTVTDLGAAATCSRTNIEKRISSYSSDSISCSGWGDVDSAQFSMRWRSLNKDAVKISYGWCPGSCGSYRSDACTWGSERKEKGTNFMQSLSATKANTHFKNPTSCIEIKCDNWHESCQLEIESVSVTRNSAEDNFVDKSLPPRERSSTELSLTEIARTVNADPTVTWTAHDDGRFVNTTHAHVAQRCGTYLPGHKSYVEMNISEPSHEALGLDASLTVADLPDEWDWRTQEDSCKDVIGLVRDQSSCGSCWAMSASETFTDRRCVTAKDTRIYSSMDVASCCKGLGCGFSKGCLGGQQGAALGWISRTGIVTGGNHEDQGSGKECRDYPFPSCSHHTSSSLPDCPKAMYKTPKCAHKCTDSSYETGYENDKTKGAGVYAVRGEAKIMQDLMTNGPQAVAFKVYTDFETYKSGVYQHHSGTMAGGHAVEFVGWGTESGVKYWLVKNSWNTAWGDGGFFKIERGVNMCGIESSVYGVHIDV